VDYRTVTPNYLTVLGVPLVQGRMLADADAAEAEPVAVVNRTFAHRFLGDSTALGQVIRGGDIGSRRVVGIVGDVKSFIGAPAQPAMYLASAQTPAGLTRGFGSWFPIHVVTRTSVDPGSLRDLLARTIHEVDPSVPVGRVRTMDEVLAGSLAMQRFMMLLLSIFATLALVLAAVGIYGVMAYFAARRIHEIGVRMALGALPGDVIGLVLGRGMMLVLAGAGIGVVGALTLARLLASGLYGVTATDPLTVAGTTALLALVALAACYLPARRAARGDPNEALRHE
jgi:putative ABC transport system permease protein